VAPTRLAAAAAPTHVWRYLQWLVPMNTFLIIEDELLFGSELKRHFERQGWHVMLVPNTQGQ
jgi:hypothetical protein